MPFSAPPRRAPYHPAGAVLLLSLLVFGGACGAPAGAAAPSRQGVAPTSTAAPTAVVPAAEAVPAAPAVPGDAAFSSLAAIEHARHLAGEIGPRPAGSAAATTAATYIAEQFGRLGYTVERQPFTYPQFEDRLSTVSVVGAEGEELIEAAPLLLSASGTVTGRLALAGAGRVEDFPRRMDGAIALMERGAQVTFREKVAGAARAGAIGAIIYNSAPSEFTGSLQIGSDIPALAISGDAGQQLRQRLESGGSLTVRAAVDASVVDRPAENVVATRSGAGAGTPRIVLGAHYDSVPVSPGANDNASGTALLLELARTLGAQPPNADLTFIAFGAEELGLLGSAHYVATLPAEARAGLRAMLNFDMVGVGDELRVGGDDALMRLTEDVAQGQGLRLGRLSRDVTRSSDQASFIAAGIPSVFFHVTEDPHYHSATDVPPNLSPERLQQIGEIGAAVVRRLAEG
ncbi:MAG: M28 family metallopeptidase [Chloroflexota bacterium]|nr:M28 family metallopeptidase [Chloroflexota bacterium]